VVDPGNHTTIAPSSTSARPCTTSSSAGLRSAATCVTEHFHVPATVLSHPGAASQSQLPQAIPESCFGNIGLSYDNLTENGQPSLVVTNIIFSDVWECLGTGSDNLECDVEAYAPPGFGMANFLDPYLLVGFRPRDQDVCVSFTDPGASGLYNVLEAAAGIQDTVTNERRTIGPLLFVLTPKSRRAPGL
jgi:hypothetical protein